MKKALVALALLFVAAGVGVGAAVLVLAVADDGAGGPQATMTTTPDDGDAIGSGPGCDHEGTRDCVAGAEIVIVDSQWRCRGPLAVYAREAGGTLPLKVTARFTTFVNTSGPVVDLREGCQGDGTEAIDLILDIQGDGRTRGGTNDGLSVKLDARDIDITGNIDCGPRLAESHQDGVQAQGARDIAFVDLEVGDWQDRRATCTGASGGIDLSVGGDRRDRPDRLPVHPLPGDRVPAGPQPWNLARAQGWSTAASARETRRNERSSLQRASSACAASRSRPATSSLRRRSTSSRGASATSSPTKTSRRRPPAEADGPQRTAPRPRRDP